MVRDIVRWCLPLVWQHGSQIAQAVAVVCVAIGVVHANETPALRLERSDASVEITHGDRPLLNYRYSQVPYKPYVDRFCSPAGRNVLRDNVPDHAHHHGLMFAVAVDGVDFWAEFPDQSPGIQRQRDLQIQSGPATATPNAATIRQQLDWTTTQGQALMTEERSITVYDPQTLAASLLTWQASLAPPPSERRSLSVDRITSAWACVSWPRWTRQERFSIRSKHRANWCEVRSGWCKRPGAHSTGRRLKVR